MFSARRVGLTIGAIFGGIFLLFFIPESLGGIVHHHNLRERLGELKMRDYLLLAGPFSMVFGTLLALKRRFQRPVAVCMCAAGTIGALMMIEAAFGDHRNTANYLAAVVMYGPAICAGILLLVAQSTQETTK